MVQIRAQAIEPRIPEFFLAVQPVERALERAALQPAIDDPAHLVALDETSVLEDAEVLDEAGERHGKGMGQVAHRLLAETQAGEHRTPRGVGECAKNRIETGG